MNTYLVEWSIDIDAANPQDAARQALAIQRNPGSIATVFSVTMEDGESVQVDLTALDDGENLTRAQAYDLIDDCATLADACALCAHWIGNESLLTEDDEAGPAVHDLDSAQGVLRDYVDEACVNDDTRRRGDSDDDLTGLTAP